MLLGHGLSLASLGRFMVGKYYAGARLPLPILERRINGDNSMSFPPRALRRISY